ncbi:MAG: patatin-like phospholipase family protein [Flavobacteriia bacterium]|nr:patatin-like phospholipase family protein [Flavobacteriia bacterium]
MTLRRILLAAGLLILSGSSLYAQDRPKVGLVLSGGGAKGFAHIGVLEILDSLGIPVDMVGGTSMGSIMGGLYAIGHSPDDLSDIVTNTNWTFITNPNPERKYLSAYDKNTDERYILTLNVTRNGLVIPSGLNPGEQIINLLSDYTVGYHDELDFTTDLPIPFVCIATDLNTGQEMVMKEGILPLSMRSSMSIPSLFNPFRYRNKYLIDGGTVNNFPADHIKDLGADIIIGVDVQTTFADSLSNPTFLKVLEKTSMYVNAMTTAQRENLCDLIIHPDMTGFGVTSFDDAEAIIESGRQAARLNMDQLLAIREQLGGPQPKTMEPYLAPSKILIDELEVLGIQDTKESILRGNLGFDIGDTVSFDEIDEAMLQLHGTRLYSLANYRAVQRGEKTVLIITVVEKPSQVKTRVGLRYDSDFETSAMLNLTSRNQLFSGSYFSLDLVASSNPRITASYLWDYGNLPGFGMDLRYWRYKSDLRLSDFNLGELNTSDFRLRAYFTKSLRRSTYFKLGAGYHEVGLSSPVTSLDDIITSGNASLKNLEIFFSGTFDDRDRSSYPTKGAFLELEAIAYATTDRSVEQLPICVDLSYEHNIHLSSKFTIRNTMYVNANLFTPNATYPYMANYGGYGQNYINNNIKFYGYHFSSFTLSYTSADRQTFFYGNHSLMERIEFQYELFKNQFILAGVNGAYVVQDVTKPFDEHVAIPLGGFAFEYGMNSIIGPISVSAHKSTERNDWQFYLNVGFWF